MKRAEIVAWRTNEVGLNWSIQRHEQIRAEGL